MVFLYEMKVNLIHDSVRNFILIKDMTSIKYVLSPLLKGDLNHLSVAENDQIILNINDVESVFKKIEYSRQFNINNNAIKIGFTPYYFYIGLIIQSIFTYLIYSLYSLKNDRDLILKQNYDLSQKLAHDIRSPVSTLNLISSKISDPDIQFLQLAVVKQINAIADNLLKAKNNTHSVVTNTHFLSPMLKNIEQEYKLKSKIISQKIIFSIDYEKIQTNPASEKLCSVIYTCLNNFIQNSIEATKPDGLIKIRTILNTEGRIELIISDNGQGISESLIERLGNEVVSHGKSNTEYSGSGIALFNAKCDLMDCGTDLKINSILNIGTEITIILPK